MTEQNVFAGGPPVDPRDQRIAELERQLHETTADRDEPEPEPERPAEVPAAHELVRVVEDPDDEDEASEVFGFVVGVRDVDPGKDDDDEGTQHLTVALLGGGTVVVDAGHVVGVDTYGQLDDDDAQG